MRKIIFDMDGVIVDFVPGLCEEHNLLTGDKLKADDITDWDLRKSGVQDETWIKPGFFWKLKPITDAIKTLESYYDSDYRFVIATDTMGIDFVQQEKAAWLNKYLPWIDEVYYLSDKSLVPGEVLFEDGPHHLRAFPGVTVKYKHPYNLDVPADHIVENWSDIDQMLKGGF